MERARRAHVREADPDLNFRIRRCVEGDECAGVRAADLTPARVDAAVFPCAERRERAVELALPAIRCADDILAAIKVVSGAVGRGAITPGEGFTLSQMMETFLRAIEASDFEGRLRELEEDQAARREEGEARRYNWAGRFDSSSRRD